MCTASGALIILQCILSHLKPDERNGILDASGELPGVETHALSRETQRGDGKEGGEGVLQSCCEVGRFKLGSDVFSSPVFINGEVIVGCRDDSVHCFQVP